MSEQLWRYVPRGERTTVAGQPWRVGTSYSIHVYQGDRPVATFVNPADAQRAVEAVNASNREPPPDTSWVRMVDIEEDARLENPCGDWPAPCNCDDPVTHNGH